VFLARLLHKYPKLTAHKNQFPHIIKGGVLQFFFWISDSALFICISCPEKTEVRMSACQSLSSWMIIKSAKGQTQNFSYLRLYIHGYIRNPETDKTHSRGLYLAKWARYLRRLAVNNFLHL